MKSGWLGITSITVDHSKYTFSFRREYTSHFCSDRAHGKVFVVRLLFKMDKNQCEFCHNWVRANKRFCGEGCRDDYKDAHNLPRERKRIPKPKKEDIIPCIECNQFSYIPGEGVTCAKCLGW